MDEDSVMGIFFIELYIIMKMDGGKFNNYE